MRRYRRADIAMQGMPGRERVGLDKTRHFMRHGTSARGGNGNGGAVYKGKAEIGMEIAKRVTTSINVSYMHVPGQQIMTYGAGLSYHFS